MMISFKLSLIVEWSSFLKPEFSLVVYFSWQAGLHFKFILELTALEIDGCLILTGK